MGMGGAFIAVADDATAASWNPAGLTQLRKPEFSVVYSHFNRSEDFDLRNHPESSSSPSVSSDDLNYLSIAYPFTLCNRNMTVSLNYQLLYEFKNNINFTYNEDVLGRQHSERTFDIKQNGQLRTLSPAYAIQVTPRLSLGMTLNFWTDNLFWSNGWTTEKVETGKIYGNASKRIENKWLQERYTDFSGFNMNFGFLWNINKFLTLGAVLKTPFTAHINYKLTKNSSAISFQPSTSQPLWRSRIMVKFRDDVDLNMPLSYGFGIACRFSDAFTMSLDVYVTDWSNYILETSKGQRYSLITAKSSRDSHVKDTTQVRLGAEYLFILTNTVIPVRGGLLYDPEPAEGHPQDFWGFSLGTGVSIKDVILDCAYQYRHGNNAGKQNLTGFPDAKADVTQHLFLASVIYHF
jgi:long-subunit fatty acid transport protein